MQRRTFFKVAGGCVLSLPWHECAAAVVPASVVRSRLSWRGADLSFLPAMEARGVIYKENGIQGDCIQILKRQGFNLVRLRLWVNPADHWCSLSQTIAMAQRAKAAGMQVLLDFHYSDTWADPGQQTTPLAWQGLSLAQLGLHVRTYTSSVLNEFRRARVMPEAVQIGNEVTDGMLWPLGRISTQGWSGFTHLLRSAHAGIDDASRGTRRPRVVMHIDRGGDLASATWFFDNLASRQVSWDVTGLSYYPWWHGSLSNCQQTLAGLRQRFGRPVFLAETAYPWTLQWNDATHNVVGLPQQVLPEHSATPVGQASFIARLVDMLHNTLGGLGLCYWAPDWIATPPGSGSGSSWENLSLFDFRGEVLPAAREIARELR